MNVLNSFQKLHNKKIEKFWKQCIWGALRTSNLWMKVNEESEKVALKLNIQKTKIMASSPVTSWEIDGETVKRVSDFILGGSKITTDGDRSHEIKRRLLLGRKVMMATHSSILAWRIPWMEEPGGLQSMGSQRVGHD